MTCSTASCGSSLFDSAAAPVDSHIVQERLNYDGVEIHRIRVVPLCCFAVVSTVNIPEWEKVDLIFEGATAHVNIGQNKIRDLTSSEKYERYVLLVGNKRLIKEGSFEKFFTGCTRFEVGKCAVDVVQ